MSERGREMVEAWNEYWATPDPERRDRKWSLYGRILELLVDIQGDERSMRIADVGCGRGLLIDRMYSLRGVNVVGFDASTAAVGICTGAGRSLIVVEADAADLPLTGGGFDVITSTDVLGFLDDPIDALKHWRKALNPDGVLIVAVPDVDFDNLPPGEPTPINVYKEATFLDALNLAGYSEVRIEFSTVGDREFFIAEARA